MDYQIITMSDNCVDNKLDASYNFIDKKEFLIFCIYNWFLIRSSANNIEKLKIKFEQIKKIFNLNTIEYDYFHSLVENFNFYAFEEGDSKKMGQCLLQISSYFFRHNKRLQIEFLREVSS